MKGTKSDEEVDHRAHKGYIEIKFGFGVLTAKNAKKKSYS